MLNLELHLWESLGDIFRYLESVALTTRPRWQPTHCQQTKNYYFVVSRFASTPARIYFGTEFYVYHETIR